MVFWGTETVTGMLISLHRSRRSGWSIAKGLTVREAGLRLKVGKTALYGALAGLQIGTRSVAA
jgi:hypothetical protein